MLKRDYPTQYCPVASTLEVIGERWTLLIIRDVFLGIRRFDDLQRDLGVARNILQVRLERLVEEGILVKRPYQERPLRSEYRLTEKGADLWPVLVSMLQWGDRYALDGGERPMILQHRGCGGELDDRRRCLTCGADVTVTEAIAIRTGARRPEPDTGAAAPAAGHGDRRARPHPSEPPGRAVARVATVHFMSDDTAWLDATGQAELVRTKEVSPSELVDAAIARIEKLNPELNAVIHELFERARAEASGALPDGPFRGVPFLLKDLGAELAGTPFCEGLAFAGDYHSTTTQALTQRYIDAGFVICGKTNTPELGILPTTEPQRFGPSRNPWDTGHSTGGSSGGSAAAVASGMVPAAHANDGGGSIRIPASCCGLVGLKPTRARNSVAPAYGDMMGGLVAEHVVTRSVRDSAAILDCTAGPVAGRSLLGAAAARSLVRGGGRHAASRACAWRS